MTATSSRNRALNAVALVSSKRLLPSGGLLPPAAAALLLLLLSLTPPPPVASGALIAPDFWDATEPELRRLAAASAPHFRPLSRMGGTARLCDTLPGYDDEVSVRLANASVVVLDADLLCADFVETCMLTSRAEKDAWVLERAAWFGRPHVESLGWERARSVVGDADGTADGGSSAARPPPPYEVPHDPKETVTARRACAGGRALLFPSRLGEGGDGEGSIDNDNDTNEGPRWIDAKGVGALDPRTYDEGRKIQNRDGVLPLFDGLYEFLNEKTVAAALGHHARTHPDALDEHFHTAGIYAVLSLGFDYPMRTSGPAGTVHYAAGAVVRQASRRSPNPYGMMHPPDAAVLEQILNAYGIRSDGPQNDYLFEGLPNPHCRRVNLQGTMRERTVTDFGPIQGEAEGGEWPPHYEGYDGDGGGGGAECLVHWLHTGVKIEPELWKRAATAAAGEDDGFGSSKVRDVLRSEFRPMSGSATADHDDENESSSGERAEGRRGVYPARTTINARISRMRELEECWYWEGSCGRDAVDEAMRVGMIDSFLKNTTGNTKQGRGHATNNEL